jgi:hypothetical protein
MELGADVSRPTDSEHRHCHGAGQSVRALEAVVSGHRPGGVGVLADVESPVVDDTRMRPGMQ